MSEPSSFKLSGKLQDYKLLIKFNLSFMVVFSALISYLLAPRVKAYDLTAILLFFQHRVGFVLGLLAGGAVTYVMIYLLALAGLKGAPNLIADGLFLSINCIAVLQLACRFSRGSSAGR